MIAASGSGNARLRKFFMLVSWVKVGFKPIRSSCVISQSSVHIRNGAVLDMEALESYGVVPCQSPRRKLWSFNPTWAISRNFLPASSGTGQLFHNIAVLVREDLAIKTPLRFPGIRKRLSGTDPTLSN